MTHDELSIQRASESLFEVSEESRQIEGYALKFGEPSSVMYDKERKKVYTEIIERGSVTQETLDKSDVICYLDHNRDKMLARSKYGQGTLTLSVDEVGVKYSFEAPKTATGNEALELIKRGDISGSSFNALVRKDNMTWENNNGKLKCTVRSFEQFVDVSPVQRPAYESTEAIVRSLAVDAEKLIEPQEGYSNPFKNKIY